MSVHLVRHPLIEHKLGLMRRTDTGGKQCRELTAEIAALLAYQATRDLELESCTVPGWAGPVQVQRIKGKTLTLVPILRAGLGMLNGVLALIPAAKVSVVGVYRNEQTLQPVGYYANLVSRLDQRSALVLDPMLATGGSVVAAVELLKQAGCKRIKSLCLVAAPEGLRHLEQTHPEVEIYTAAVDKGLNDRGYILPGLGDAGDRIFGTN